MAVVVTVFRVIGETMTETGMYKECFLQFVDLGMTTEGTGGVKGGVDCGGSVAGEGSEGVSGMGSTGRAAKRFEGQGEGVGDARAAGRVKGVEGLEGPKHFWIMCPGCLHRKQSPFLVQRSRSSGVKGAR